MSLWSYEEIIAALSDEIIAHNLEKNLQINEVAIDSRKQVRNWLFIAIKGEKNDGNQFLDQAFTNDAIAAIIDDKTKFDKSGKNQLILVKNSFTALYKLAEFSRQRSQAKIIAITGSVGKTSNKEMLRDSLQNYGKTFATIGNLNNHFGVPLSLCNFAADCKFGVFEMGMNHANEIKPLSLLVKPDIAIITNVAPVHIENFANETGIALAKSEIFYGLKEDGIALINYDNSHFEFLYEQAEQHIPEENIISFGSKENSDYQILEQKIIDANSAEISAKLQNDEKISYKIASSHNATIFNSIITIAITDIVVGDLTPCLESFKNIAKGNGRGKIFDVNCDGKNVTVIDETYNANVMSFEFGINHAANLKKNLNKKRLITAIGDMLELGKNSIELHEKVIEFVNNSNADLAILVGSEMNKASEKLVTPHKNFPDSVSAAKEIRSLIADGDLIYLKGSRGVKMEKLIENLTSK